MNKPVLTDKDGISRDVDDLYRREMDLLRSKEEHFEKENLRLQVCKNIVATKITTRKYSPRTLC